MAEVVALVALVPQSDGVELIEGDGELVAVAEYVLAVERILEVLPHGEAQIVGLSGELGVAARDRHRAEGGEQVIAVVELVVVVALELGRVEHAQVVELSRVAVPVSFFRDRNRVRK